MTLAQHAYSIPVALRIAVVKVVVVQRLQLGLVLSSGAANGAP